MMSLNMESAHGWTHRGLQRRLQEVEEQAGFGFGESMGNLFHPFFIPCQTFADFMLNWPTVPPVRTKCCAERADR